MTAQLPDEVVLRRRRYSLTGSRGGPLFDPQVVGVVPMAIHTACRRGYVATYAVTRGRLVLTELLLGARSLVEGDALGSATDVLGRVPAPHPTMGAYVIRDLGYPVPYTGTLLLGHGLVRSHYRHAGFHPAWAHTRVVELALTDGRLDEVRDRSREAAQRRERVGGTGPGET